jgi:hypothetical protein
MSIFTANSFPSANAGRRVRQFSALAAFVVAVAGTSAATAQTPTPTTTPVPTFAPDTCYAVPDSIDRLVSMDASTGVESVIGLTGAGSTMRGLAMPPVGNTLYGATATTLGSINRTTGAFTAIGNYGTAINGELGPIELNELVALTFNSSDGILLGVHRTNLDPDTCFGVAATGDTLVTIDRGSGNDTAVGGTSNGIEAVALVGTTLYAAIGDQLGVLDRSTGTFTARSATFGQGDPGPVLLDDIRGLTFDIDNRVMFASHRVAGGDDLLFVVSLATGAHVPLQFNAATDDYATISGGSCVSPVDIEALAMDASGTTLYGSDGDDLVVIDAPTGTCDIIGDFGGGGPAITITGMGFADDGTLYGSDNDQLYTIDTGTGTATPVGGGLGVGTDYRALDCPITLPDVMFRIDPATGSYVPLHFDFDTYDYVLLEGTCGTEIEALAYDQYNDVLLGIDGTNDRLVDIDAEDGLCTAATPNPLGVSDIVSMTFSEATNEVYAAGTSTRYIIDRIGGTAQAPLALTAGTNYEAFECPTQGCPLVVRKRHIGVPYAGAEIGYRLFWLNPCEGVTFTNVVLTDNLPAGLDLVSASSTSAVVQTSGDNVTLIDALLPKSPAQFGTLRARITASAGSRVTNTLTLRDNYGRVFSSSDTIKVREARGGADLSLHAQSRTAPGKSVTYTARYGDVAASNQLTLTLPASVQIVTVYPAPLSTVGNVLTWQNLPTPAGGVRVRTQVSEAVAAATVLTATARLTDSGGTDLESIRDTIVTGAAGNPGGANVSLSLAAAKQVAPGLVTTISIKYRDVQGTASVEVTLPPGLSPSSSTPEALVSGSTLTWTGLPPGEGAIKLKVRVDADAAPGSLLTVNASISASGSGNASDSAQLAVRN